MRLRTRATTTIRTRARDTRMEFLFSASWSLRFAFSATAIIPARLYRLAADKHNRRPK